MKIGNHIIIIYLIFMALLSSSCNTWQNQPGMSEDIAESKKRGIFICEYETLPNPMKINDSIEFDIKTAWLERRWRYPENWKETNLLDGYQLIIRTKNDIPKNFDGTWSIGLNSKRYIRSCGKNCLMTDFKNLPISNKELWCIKVGSEINTKGKEIVLGNFILYKKYESAE